MASDSGAGHYVEFLIRRCLLSNIFRSYMTIGKARQTGVRALPILLFPLYCTNTIGTAIHTPLIGEARQI
jgi:hypothetical protein